MLLRVRSSQGTARIETLPTDSLLVLKQKIGKALSLPKTTSFSLSPTPNAKDTLFDQSHDRNVSALGLRHGDMIYVNFSTPQVNTTTEPSISPATKSQSNPQSKQLGNVKQDEVDDILEKQDGLIKRSRDPKFCVHGAVGMCDYCMPLEPYDAKYLEENRIKHMSFHSYLRKLTAATRGQNKPGSASFVSPLDEPTMIVNPNCSGSHEPWPKGICTKCQPSAVTLQRQTFRLVDHVEFSSASLIENFLRFWRSSGSQRFGYLYGRYEPYTKVPLGVKAKVEAIYEPPQENAADRLQLKLPWEGEEEVDRLAAGCGLVKLGCIYTDLMDDGTGRGTVVCKRHIGSHFLSSQECVFAAQMQLKNPSPCRWSSSGNFGSKFITCVISGQEEGGIDVSAYQVSNTSMAMVSADLVEPSVDPSVMRVRDATETRYVPEVFYKYKNEYGAPVQRSAKPSFPVDYLLVNVTHGFPQNPSPLFTSPISFPIENREMLERQDLKALKKQMQSTPRLQDAVSDFHVLNFIQGMHVLDKNDMELLLRVATKGEEDDVKKLATSGAWQTLLAIAEDGEHMHAQETGMSGSASSGGAGSTTSSTGSWACRHCTFRNSSGGSCDMCGLPRD